MCVRVCACVRVRACICVAVRDSASATGAAVHQNTMLYLGDHHVGEHTGMPATCPRALYCFFTFGYWILWILRPGGAQLPSRSGPLYQRKK